MTEDANNQEMKQAYRDLATETTPPGLDDKVLRMAAREARSRYGIARAWVRPVAWAATIGLSLAIVLEVLQVIPAPSAPEPSAIIETVPEPVSADQAPAVLEQEATRREDAPTARTVGAMSNDVPVNPGGGAAEEMAKSRARVQEPIEEKEARSVVLEDADAFAPRDTRILEEADMQARQRAGDPGIATFAAVSTEARVAHCDETARETAESWFECIEDLRDTGNAEFADSELAALSLAFPDFEVPPPSK